MKGQGAALTAGALSHIFDPKFEVTRGRVAAGNWSLFTARQIIREQGGEITISSEEDGVTAI